MTSVPCAECRDLLLEVRAAGRRLARKKPFAHAHHAITPDTHRARVAYLTVAAHYRIHKNHCPQRGARAA